MVALGVTLYFGGYGLSIYKWGPAYFALPLKGEIVYTGGLTLFVRDLMLASSIWAYLNLLPVYPMDGGRIARGLLQLLNPREGIRLSLFLSIIIGVGMVIAGLVSGDNFLAYYFLLMTYANIEALQRTLS
jgi:Zn-dependent protease